MVHPPPFLEAPRSIQLGDLLPPIGVGHGPEVVSFTAPANDETGMGVANHMPGFPGVRDVLTDTRPELRARRYGAVFFANHANVRYRHL